jgi:hypothetical protein
MIRSVPIPVPPAVTYTIAVGGSMNPAIHHLFWYLTIGAIDEAEYQASLKFPFNTTTQLMSQIRLVNPRLAIQCQPQEWMIQGFGDESWPRMVRIATLVFEKLKETPVVAYSMVSEKHLDTTIPDVKAVLADRIYGMNLALPRGNSVGSSIELTTAVEDYQVKTALQPSVTGLNKLFVYYQHQYIPPQEPGKYFDIGQLITERVDAFCEAQMILSRQAISALSE